MEYLLIFSQDDEDLMLYHALKNIKEVRWIDVGANDPINASVTKFFSLRGGYGVNVEPQHIFYKKLKEDRPNDTNIEAGVSNKKGTMTLYGREGSQIASFANKGGYNSGAKSRKVPVLTLKEICESCFEQGDDIHFLKIDVEGWEGPCIEGMDFNYVKPWILCVESSNLDGKPVHSEWERLLMDAGYVFALQYRENRFYVSKEHMEYKEKLVEPTLLRKTYNITKYTDNKKYERYENMGRRFKSSVLMRPIRFIYNYVKNRKTI